MSVRVRFAPSPTGYLHVGGARTALYNYLFARAHGGDVRAAHRGHRRRALDRRNRSARSSTACAGWGSTWDEGPGVGGEYGPYFAERASRVLRPSTRRRCARPGAPTRCFCTADELEARRAAQLARGEAPRYDGRCRALDAGRARRALAPRGAPRALRFALPDAGEIAWDDVRARHASRSRTRCSTTSCCVRSDGLPTYNFACVVDDLEMQITHVIRGDDHISNTPRQLLLYRALGAAPPVFAHVPDDPRAPTASGSRSATARRRSRRSANSAILPEAHGELPRAARLGARRQAGAVHARGTRAASSSSSAWIRTRRSSTPRSSSG